MAKKKVCIACGGRKVGVVCYKCKGNICDMHLVAVDIGARIEQRSMLGLPAGRKAYPTIPLCCDDKGKGCAKKVVDAILGALK